MIQLEAIRLIDEQWSREVQEGRLPFDPDIARTMHKLYQAWWEQAGKHLDKGSLTRFMVEKGILSVDIEDLIESHGQAERGETVSLEDFFKTWQDEVAIPPAGGTAGRDGEGRVE